MSTGKELRTVPGRAICLGCYIRTINVSYYCKTKCTHQRKLRASGIWLNLSALSSIIVTANTRVSLLMSEDGETEA